jgi:flavin reductase (DIM6/NTAB) family NADH-FMN oxidoreductase RutF/ribosomal protein S18 acetylase RimI-like enzyme
VSASNFTYLLHPYNTSLVTCCDSAGKPNIITIAWLIPVSVTPPLVGLCMRKTRFSYNLITTTGEFVINLAPIEIAREALYCGRRSGSQVDKFLATGLTPLPAQKVRPPIIKECIAYLECRVKQDIEFGDHNLLIAEVLAAYAHPDILTEDDLYDLTRGRPLLHLGRNCFTSTQPQAFELSLMTFIQIRLADAGEAEYIASILLQAFTEFEPLYTPEAFAATTPTMEQIQNRWGEGPVWVAIDHEAIVGTVAAVPTNEGLYIRSMAVLPYARGHGIGELLLLHVERYAVAQGFYRMVLSTTPFLVSAIRVYEKFGFQRTGEGPLELMGTPLFTMEKYLKSQNSRSRPDER